jgi:SHS2 domain-containing protein
LWAVDHHTADVRVRVAAATLEELFADAVRGLTEVMHPAGAGAPAAAEIELDALDATALLVDFLNEVLTRSHIEHAAFAEARFASLTETALRATIWGARVEGFEEDVKSVTYHEARVVRDGGAWRVTLVLDI